MAGQKTITKVNGIDMDILQGTVNAIQQEPELGKCKFRVSNRWLGATHNCSTVASFYGAKQEIDHKQPFKLHADEPPILAGGDQGANPVEYLLSALVGCITTGIVAHAAVRGIHIEELESEVEGDIDLNGFLGLSEDAPRGFTNIRARFKVKSDVDDIETLRSLIEYSPVYDTLIHGVNVDVKVDAK